MSNIELILTREHTPVIPARRKCYKCGRTHELKHPHFMKSPSADRVNFGLTWACYNCIDRDALAMEGWI